MPRIQFAVRPALVDCNHPLNESERLKLCIRVYAASLPRVTKKQVRNVQMIYNVLNRPSIRPFLACGPYESRITSGTISQVLRSLRIEGKDYLDIVPSAESLFCATALGANSACGLGSLGSPAEPADWAHHWGAWEVANAEISHALGLSAQPTFVQWYDRDILDLCETTCPFCDPAVDPFYDNQNQWAVLAFWEQLPKIKQDHILSLCSSTSSYVTSLAVCKDSNWTSETSGHLAKLSICVRAKLIDFCSGKSALPVR